MRELSMKINRDHPVWDMLRSRENVLINAGHIGTHVDVYKKSSIPEKYFETRGVVINCECFTPDEEIGKDVLEDVELNEGDFIIFVTKIKDRYPYGSNEYLRNHHQLSWALINHLISKKVSFIGIDGAGIRRGKEHKKADVLCEENCCYVVENLDMADFTEYGRVFTINTIWFDNPLSTGLPVRVFAHQ